jgi:hypothetical protein
MPKLADIYGIDSNAFAGKIASEALSQGQGSEDIWGSLTQDKAEAKGNKPDDPGPVKVVSDKADSRATTKGNHGTQG